MLFVVARLLAGWLDVSRKTLFIFSLSFDCITTFTFNEIEVFSFVALCDFNELHVWSV